MGRMTISLDEKAETWVQAQAGDNANGYVNDLIHQDQEYKRKLADLKRAIQDGLDSGVSDRSIDDAWNEAERELLLKNG